MRSFKSFAWVSGIFLLSCLTSIYWIDRPLSQFVKTHLETVDELFKPMISALELIFGFKIFKYLFGFILLLVGGLLYVLDKNGRRANPFFFIALTRMANLPPVGRNAYDCVSEGFKFYQSTS